MTGQQIRKVKDKEANKKHTDRARQARTQAVRPNNKQCKEDNINQYSVSEWKGSEI